MKNKDDYDQNILPTNIYLWMRTLFLVRKRNKMNNIKIVICILFLMTTTAFAQTWIQIVPSFSTGDTAYNMSNGIMVTKNIGWFADNYVPIGNGNFKSLLYKTTNGGHYWTMQYEGDGLAGFWDFFALDSLHCFVLYGYGLLRTTNGGITWEYKHVDSLFGYTRVFYFFDEREGFLFQKYPRRTTDGGDSWQILDTSFALNFLSDIHFSTRSKGWITGDVNPRATDCGFFIKSVDSGKIWRYTHDTLYPPPSLKAIDFVDSLHGYVIGTNVGGGCLVSYTSNGGEQWGGAIGSSGSCGDIAFLDTNRGWITGANGRISSSLDGGKTWNQYQIEGPLRLGKISAIRSERIVYIFGEKNTLLRADMTAGVHEEPKPVAFTLYQNYPNPFNPGTIIRYSLPESRYVLLNVYNILGKEIATLVNSKQPPGNYETVFNASVLPSGIYFYELATGTETVRKKMMVVK